MNVSLDPQLDAYVQGLVEAGDYGSASEVVHEALRLFKEKQARDSQQAELRRLVREGLESPVVETSRDEMKELMRERMRHLRAEVERGERPAPGGPGAIPV